MTRLGELTIDKIAEMKNEGKTEKEISEYFNLTTTMYRMIKAKMVDTRWNTQVEIAKRMRERGMPLKEIAECIGTNESTIKSWEMGQVKA